MIPFLGVTGCLLVLAVSMAALSAWRRHSRVSPEVVRKVLHVEMGLIAAGFPWIFNSAWQVLVLAGFALTWFWAVKSYRPLRIRFGDVLYGVRRKSRGEYFFVVGVAAVYLLSASEPAYYCTALLVTTLADTAAAVVGRGLGRHRFRTDRTRKSLEGSCAFYCVAFACTIAVLTALVPSQSGSILTAALVVATVTTILEAIAGDGADNLLVPVGALAALHLAIAQTMFPHIIVLIVLAATFAIAWNARPRKRGSHA